MDSYENVANTGNCPHQRVLPPTCSLQAGAAVRPNVRAPNLNIGAVMRIAPPRPKWHLCVPDPPESPEVDPLLALALAIAVATAAGVLVGWVPAVTVLVAVLSLFGAARRR